MKYYLKLLGLSVLFGMFCFYGSDTFGTDIRLSELIMYPAFFSADFYPQFIMSITHWFVPLLTFQILFGTYIYRHFCSASVYYFSRNKNRIKWYLQETAKLYVFVLCYLGGMLLSGIAITAMQRPIIFDNASIGILLYYLLIHSLYLFVTTLGINILSIRFSGITAFGVVEGINLSAIAIFTLLGSVIDEIELIQKHSWIFKVNPFAHLVFTIHSSRIKVINTVINIKGIQFDLNVSVIFFAILVTCTMFLGGVGVNQCEFLTNSKEEI